MGTTRLLLLTGAVATLFTGICWAQPVGISKPDSLGTSIPLQPIPELTPTTIPGTGASPNEPSKPPEFANPGSTVPQSASSPFGMNARWNTTNPGVFFESPDKRFVLHPGATVHYDAAFYSASSVLQTGRGNVGKFNDGANLRRGRIFFEGTLYESIDFKFEMEFANGFSPAGLTGPVAGNTVSNSPGPTDAWITIKEVPWVGNVRIGNQKEWFSLEHLNNYRALEFMERSYLFDISQVTAFNNGFTPGISVFRTWLNDRVFSAVGVYKNESDLLGFGLGDGNYAVTGRLAALPIWMPEDRMFWHVGAAMSHRDPVSGQVQLRVRNNIRNAPFPLLNLIANTGAINATSQQLYNIETAAVWGPLTLQAEYTGAVLNGTRVGTDRPIGGLFFGGYYAEALVLLTGESRTWNPKLGVFNRVVPLHPLKFTGSSDEGRGFGALEVGVRFTYLDLSDKTIRAGQLQAVTLGVNWYMNTSAKLQMNYDYAERSNTNNPAQGHIHSFGTRMAFDF